MTVPAWPAEDAICAECGFDYAADHPTDTGAALRGTASAVRDVVEHASAAALRQAGPGETWSMVEYLCHLRDVHVTTTIRLYRARTEELPRVEPMLNDLRAIRFGYARAEPAPVLDDLDRAVAGACDEVERIRDLRRPVERLPGERRSTRWLVGTALHEGRHHLSDLERLLRR